MSSSKTRRINTFAIVFAEVWDQQDEFAKAEKFYHETGF